MAEKKPNRKRNVQKLIRFTPDEWELVMQKVGQSGMGSYSAYIREMAMKGYVIELDIAPMKELTKEIGAMSRNINQITKRINTTDTVYQEDMAEINELMEKVWQLLRFTLLKLL